MNAQILTLDAGTTSLKCTLFNTDGRPLFSAASAYTVNYPESGWAEQPVERLFAAAQRAIAQVIERTNPKAIAAIGISGSSNGCIPIDASGNALHPNILHADTRATDQVAYIRSVISDQDYYQRTGNRIDVHYTLPKLLWLRDNRPEVFQKARWFIQAKDALYGFLTGIYGMSDYSDGSLTGALYIRSGSWDEALLRTLDLDVACMPQLRVSHDMEGRLTRRTARLLGLTGGTPVAIGGNAGACASHGAGMERSTDACCSLGSSAWLSMVSDAPVIDRSMRVYNAFDMDGRRYNVCGMVQSGASALDWAAARLLLGRAPSSRQDYAILESMAIESPPGARGVFFLPTLMGERTPWWDPNARGTLVGMSMHHTEEDIARSIYEGIGQAVHLCGVTMKENNLSPERLTLIGGGALSGIWPQMLADMFEARTRVHADPREATSLGAAMAAGVGMELFADYEDAAKRMTRFLPEQEPLPARHNAYIPHLTIYRSLYWRLRDMYREITEYQLSRFGKPQPELMLPPRAEASEEMDALEDVAFPPAPIAPVEAQEEAPEPEEIPAAAIPAEAPTPEAPAAEPSSTVIFRPFWPKRKAEAQEAKPPEAGPEEALAGWEENGDAEAANLDAAATADNAPLIRWPKSLRPNTNSRENA